jgi:uncharacterized RDD family membrane protein YckC
MMWVMEAYHSQVGLNEFKSRTTMGSGVVLLWIVWYWIYSAIGESSSHQATPGKRLLQLKVGTLDGNRPSFQQATCRFFSKFLSTFALLGGFAVAVLHPQRQSLHDMIAGTLVYRQNDRETRF